MQQIISQIQLVRNRIADAAIAAGRSPAEIRLVAVSKTRSLAEVKAAQAAGIQDFGESYLQEALTKVFGSEPQSPCWHFIGAIQSNKTRDIARHFDWVQTLDRKRIAARLARDRPAAKGPLNVLIQVNIDREPQKAGVHPDALAELIDAVLQLPALRLRGLMAIPQPDDDGCARRASLTQMSELFGHMASELIQSGEAADNWDTLSMGMTNDFALAIAEGATMVRIGTGIFGARTR
jgi:PLP dependent protein